MVFTTPCAPVSASATPQFTGEPLQTARSVLRRYRLDIVSADAPEDLIDLVARLDHYILEVVRGTYLDFASSIATPSDRRVTASAVPVSHVARPPSIAPARAMSSPRFSSSRTFRRPSQDDRSVRDSFSMFLDEIGRYPRLTREEERELSARALNGDEEAVERLVQCNLRLVVSVVTPFTRGKFQVQELVSPGAEGLMIAARRYDWRVGVPFGNYAAIWIKQRVLRYIAENGGVVRIPHYRAAIVNKVVRENARLKQALGREPTLDELWQRMQEVDPKCSYSEVEEVFRLYQPALDLDAPMRKDGEDSATFGAYFGESIAEAEERISAQLEKIDLQHAVDEALSLLNEREALVIAWNFGLKGNRAMDLEQIAVRIGVTRERARQIRSAALKKLQDSDLLARFVE